MEKMYEVYTSGMIPPEFYASIVSDLDKLNIKNKVRAVLSFGLWSFTIVCSMNTESKMDKHAKEIFEMTRRRFKKNTDITRFELAY